MSKYMLIGVVLLGMGASLVSADSIPGGNVSGIWYEANSPYYILGNIAVPNDSSLLVEPGVAVNFLGSYRCVVYGYITAIGTISDSIHFFNEDTATGWRGFLIYDADELCEFKYCILEGVLTGGGSMVRAALRCRSSSVNVENSRISDCVGTDQGPAIKLFLNSDLTLTDCVITNNTTTAFAGAAYVYDNSELILENCTFSNNTSADNGGAIYIVESDLYMDGCIIHGNTSDGHSGGALFCDQSIIEIDYSVFSCNAVNYSATSSHGGGGIALEDCEVNIKNCTFDRNAALYNGHGGAIMGIDCSEYDIVDCIFHNNSGAADGGGVYSVTNEPDIIYCDFYGNINGNCSGAVPADFGVLSTTNYNGDSCDVYYNIFLCPEFVDSATGNYYLLNTSPCIDGGDPVEPFDPDSTIGDIGAYYFDQTGISEHEKPAGKQGIEISCTPNPTRGRAVLSYILDNPGMVRIDLFDAAGRLVKNLKSDTQSAGLHTLEIEDRNLATGIYFIKIHTPDGQHAKTMTIIR
jgi:hypothetical protein